MPKKVTFFLISIILTVTFMECVAYISYIVVNKKHLSLSSINKNAINLISSTQDNNYNNGRQSDYLIHPYFGYVSKTDLPKNNDQKIINLARSYGFDTAGQLIDDYPEMYFNVAILGGSVAKYFVANMANTIKDYIERIPQAKGKKVVILGLGNYSYKEPQQLNIVNDLIAQGAHFDIVINIDGFNEVAHPEVHNIANNVSPFFPSGWSDRTGEVASNEDLALLGKISLYSDLRVLLAKLYVRFGYGITASSMWTFADMFLANRIYALEASRLNRHTRPKMTGHNYQSISPSGKISFGPHREYTKEELYPALAVHWAISSAIIENIVSSAGGKYFQFLQPNQYDTGSKTLSQEEKATRFSEDSPYKIGVEKGYNILRKAGKVLADAGVEFVDTSNLFYNHHETLYLDDCCHYNKVGETLLAQFIGDYIMSHYERQQTPSSIERIQAQLDDSIENIGRIKRLATHYDLTAADLPSDISVSGLSIYEKNTERHFRWGLGPTTSIKLMCPSKTKIRLSAQFLSATPDQSIDIVVNGRHIERWSTIEYTKTATKMSERTLTFDAAKGANVIELLYNSWQGEGQYPVITQDPRKFAVMFQQLDIDTMLR